MRRKHVRFSACDHWMSINFGNAECPYCVMQDLHEHIRNLERKIEKLEEEKSISTEQVPL